MQTGKLQVPAAPTQGPHLGPVETVDDMDTRQLATMLLGSGAAQAQAIGPGLFDMMAVRDESTLASVISRAMPWCPAGRAPASAISYCASKVAMSSRALARP